MSATWTKLLSSPDVQRSSHCIAVVGERVYIYGVELKPREPVGGHLKVIEISQVECTKSSPQCSVTPDFAGKQGNLQTLSGDGPSPQPRVGSAMTALGDKLYMFSGCGGIEMAPLEEHGSLRVYDIVHEGWSQTTPIGTEAPFPEGRSYHAMTNNGTDTV
jgi:hypothetical protein